MLHFLFLAAAAAAAFEDLDILDQRIATIAPGTNAIDRRLKLARCPADAIIETIRDGAVVVRCPALGWRMHVPLKATATPANGGIVVRKGDLVDCVSDGSGFSVSVPMVALEDAGVGEPVRVKSPSSPIVITAYAKARGVVSF
ncbi:MAG: flagella basal body P-ring formation protein FlgA [Sphingomonadaceae bacterium]|nr:flagella basal body P-ring formation protein FlgA [Sphingomonadaceae bacterium]